MAENSLKPADSLERIEISPEMIEVGAAALCRIELAFADEEFWAAKVYRAMCAADLNASRD